MQSVRDVAEQFLEVVNRRRAEQPGMPRPLGLFILAGPDSERALQIARAVAELAFGDSEAVLRFDMTRYKERHLITELMGAPPGIIGYGPPGLLTEPVRLNPEQVVLLERIEEAHTDAQNMLWQVAEEGRLVDNRGQEVDFHATIIILTIGFGVSARRVIRPELLELTYDVIGSDGDEKGDGANYRQ